MTCGLATAVGILACVSRKACHGFRVEQTQPWPFFNIVPTALRDLPAITMNGNLPGSIVTSLMILTAAAAFSGWLNRWRSLRGTTLRAPCYWTLAAFAGLTLAQVASPIDATHWKYVAAVGTFCPLVAVLGAKRPQDRAWQFIVAALWVVLALPGLEQWFGRRHATLELHAAWQWFLAILIALGLFNGLPTRLWPSSLLMAIAQTAMFANQLPWLRLSTEQTSQAWIAGLFAWCLSTALWGWDLPRRRTVPIAWDRLWLDFRDLIGAVWAIRVLERINAAASTCGWKSRLRWNGWATPKDEPTLDPALERSMRMLLRRFVSPKWIEQRLSDDIRPLP